MQFKGMKLILSPYHVGIRDRAVGAEPQAIINAGLPLALECLQITVDSATIEPVDDFEGEIGRSFELMRRIAAAVRSARQSHQTPIVLAGNCFNSVGVAAGVDDISQDELGIIWHDAHDEYHTPDTLSSGYFDAQGVSMLIGGSWRTLVSPVPGFSPLCRNNVIFCGARDITDVMLATY